jgi:hypothetical protein
MPTTGLILLGKSLNLPSGKIPSQMVHHPRPAVRIRFPAVGMAENDPVHTITTKDRPTQDPSRPEISPLQRADSVPLRERGVGNQFSKNFRIDWLLAVFFPPSEGHFPSMCTRYHLKYRKHPRRPWQGCDNYTVRQNNDRITPIP